MNKRVGVCLKEISTKITKGTTPTTVGHSFTESGINFIKAESITRHGTIDASTFAFIDEKTHTVLRRSQIETGDVLVTIAGIYLGKVAQVRKEHLPANTNQAVAIVRVNRQLALPEFVRCFLLEPSTTKYLNQLCPQSAQPNLNLKQLGETRFALPPVESQQKIAAILTAYDDLIETNQRRIALLERMAEEIYREWFVRLRFPGHKKTKIIKGMPQGWCLLPFDQVVAINPTERVDKEDERPFVGMEDLSVCSMYFAVKERRNGNVGPKFRNGDVLFPRITPSVENGKRGLVMSLNEDEVAHGSTEFIVFRERLLSPEHIYFLSCSEGFRTNAELSMTGASGRQRVQERCFSSFLVKTPPKPLRDQFVGIVRPMVRQIRLLAEQTEVLTRTRDLLLPRLISGKLRVDDLDIQFPPSIAESAVKERAC